jgi:hypothetical protein
MKREFTPELTPTQLKSIRRTKLYDQLQYGVLVLFGLFLLFCAVREWVTVGEVAIAAFGVLGLVLRFGANRVFVLAIATFVAIPLSGVLAPYSEVPETLAVFGFLLLLLGLIFSLGELVVAKVIHKRGK